MKLKFKTLFPLISFSLLLAGSVLSYLTVGQIPNNANEIDREIASSVNWLKKHQNTEGYWGFIFYRVDEIGATQNYTVQDTETTAYSIFALVAAGEQYSPNLQKAVIWLRDQQHDDGSWGLNKDLEGHVAYTSLSILALIASGERADSPSIQKGIVWLQNNRNAFNKDEIWRVYIEPEKWGENFSVVNISAKFEGEYGIRNGKIKKLTTERRHGFEIVIPKGTKTINITLLTDNPKVGAVLLNQDDLLVDSSQGSFTLNLSYVADGFWGAQRLTRYSEVESIYALMALKAIGNDVLSDMNKLAVKKKTETKTVAYGAMLDDADSLNKIKATQNIDGGWGEIEHDKSDVRTTAISVCALVAKEPNSSKIQQGVNVIIKQKNLDDGWGLNKGQSSTALSTSHALLALSCKKNNEAILYKILRGKP